MNTDRLGGSPESAATDGLTTSAQGWHRIQLGVLGFIGLCGVLQSGAAVPGPDWVAAAAGWLVAAALGLACLATYLVGRVAWPLRQPRPAPERNLRLGVGLTYLAVVAVVVAALANWWPEDPGGSGDAGTSGAVRVTDASGQSWCGQLVDAPAGSLRLATGRDEVDLDSATITQLVSVDGC